ncbi:MAG: amino acid synthesis family protein, partial [Rhodospirillaceae bacterium]|nr:amino acid synthesis family protein [Rhodospirillaceae bacterium]
MPEVHVRKMLTVVEEVFHEGGPRAAAPLRRGAVLAVIRNPYAGRYEPDIMAMMDDLRPLGLE